MTKNTNINIKNLNTFTNAYGLNSKSRKLLERIKQGGIHVDKIGILLRNHSTKQGLISCHFPLDKDITNQMLWIATNEEKEFEASPVVAINKASHKTRQKAGWKKYNDGNEEKFLKVWEGDFTMQVHPSFAVQGVVIKYDPAKRQGFIKRRGNWISFKEEWCNLGRIKIGDVISFLPVISRNGLQARAIEEVKS